MESPHPDPTELIRLLFVVLFGQGLFHNALAQGVAVGVGEKWTEVSPLWHTEAQMD